MDKHKDFRISVGDDEEFEELTAEIYYKETFVVMLSQEQGFDNLQLEISSNPSGETWSFRLDDFLEIVDHAKQKLWDLRKIE